jgi:cell division protein FtsW
VSPRKRTRGKAAPAHRPAHRIAARRHAAPASVGARGEAALAALRLDGGALLAGGGLLGMGVVMSYSSTAPLALDRLLPPLFVEHVGALALGLVAATAALLTPLRWLRALALPAWGLAVALLLATDLFGVEVNGAKRWLPIPGLGFRFQPVEVAKLATLLAVCNVVARNPARRELSPRRGAAAVAIVAIPVALLVRQPDFGNAVLLSTLATVVLVAAGTPIRRLAAPGLLAAGAIASYIATHEYALRRVIGFLDPWKDPLGLGFQLVQSFVAFGKGGVSGVGLGAGRQKLSYLPEGHTDFILALIAEELGLLGVLMVLGCFAALWVAGTRIARQSKDRFALLVALAMTSLLTLPAAVNAAVVMGLLPTKGLTLPFLSHGGSSLVMSCAVLGLLLAAGRQASAPAKRGHRR